jgi:hypothetical protein
VPVPPVVTYVPPTLIVVDWIVIVNATRSPGLKLAGLAVILTSAVPPPP